MTPPGSHIASAFGANDVDSISREKDVNPIDVIDCLAHYEKSMVRLIPLMFDRIKTGEIRVRRDTDSFILLESKTEPFADQFEFFSPAHSDGYDQSVEYTAERIISSLGKRTYEHCRDHPVIIAKEAILRYNIEFMGDFKSRDGEFKSLELEWDAGQRFVEVTIAGLLAHDIPITDAWDYYHVEIKDTDVTEYADTTSRSADSIRETVTETAKAYGFDDYLSPS